MDVPEPEESVRLARATDRRNSMRVRFDRDRRGEAGDADRAVQARYGRDREDEEKNDERSHDDEEREESLSQDGARARGATIGEV
jgi:hypothetical protein